MGARVSTTITTPTAAVMRMSIQKDATANMTTLAIMIGKRKGGGGETAGQPPVTPAARPSPPASTRARFRPSLPLACAAQEVADRQVEGGDVRARQDDKILL